MTARRWVGVAGWRSLAPLVCGLAATWWVVGSSYAHRGGSMPVGTLGEGLQRAFWLPWQLADNLTSGRSLLDGSVFVTGGPGDLLAYAGNPGGALLGALVHLAVADPVRAHDAWILVIVCTNAVAMAALGRALSGGRVRGALLGAAMGAGCAVWARTLGEGAVAAGWIAPAASFLAAWTAGRMPGVVLAGALGALVAPVSMLAAVALVVTGVMSRADPLAPGVSVPRALALALTFACACVVRVTWPPLGAGLAAPDMVLAQWCGPLAGVLGEGRVSMPLLAGAGVVVLLHASGWRRGVGVLAVVAALFVLGPWFVRAGGDPARVAGFGVAAGASGARWWVAEGASALAFVGLVGILGAGHGRVVGLALATWSLAEPSLLADRGQPARLWPGAAWPVPAALRELAATPRAHVVAALPLLETRDGAVGLVPFHRQRVVAPPGVHQEVAARRRFLQVVHEDTSLRTLAAVGRDQLAGTVAPAAEVAAGLRARGIDRVALLGGDPVLRASLTHRFGTGVGDVWRVDPPPPHDPGDRP